MRKPEVTRAPAEQTFGRYSLVEPIAKGGMAEVWRAKLVGAENFERPMVIKRILPHLCGDPEFVRLFVAEARLSARLHHPNIVQVFELGDVDGELFMALEQVVGVDLRTLLRARGGPLPPGLCALITHEICRALAYAQGVADETGAPLSIVHRDVSPSNVLVGYDGQVRLCDFGIAKALGVASKERTRTGSIKGKLGYLAPEFVEGAPFDHRADLFAVGILAYEMLTGRRLFKADDDLHTLQLVRACEVPPLRAQQPDIPPALEALTLKALERDPADRWQHADEMVAALAPILHDLRWGARETVAVVRDAVPESAEPPEPSRPTRSATIDGHQRGPRGFVSGTRHVSRTAQLRRRWPLPVALATLAAIVGLVFLLRGGSPAKDGASPQPPTAPNATAPNANGAAVAPSSPAGPIVTPLPAPAGQPPTEARPTGRRPELPVAALPDPPPGPAVEPSVDRSQADERRHKADPSPRKKRPHNKSFNLERGDVLDSL